MAGLDPDMPGRGQGDAGDLAAAAIGAWERDGAAWGDDALRIENAVISGVSSSRAPPFAASERIARRIVGGCIFGKAEAMSETVA
jgi:hypothetical protein